MYDIKVKYNEYTASIILISMFRLSSASACLCGTPWTSSLGGEAALATVVLYCVLWFPSLVAGLLRTWLITRSLCCATK